MAIGDLITFYYLEAGICDTPQMVEVPDSGIKTVDPREPVAPKIEEKFRQLIHNSPSLPPLVALDIRHRIVAAEVLSDNPRQTRTVQVLWQPLADQLRRLTGFTEPETNGSN